MRVLMIVNSRWDDEMPKGGGGMLGTPAEQKLHCESGRLFLGS